MNKMVITMGVVAYVGLLLWLIVVSMSWTVTALVAFLPMLARAFFSPSLSLLLPVVALNSGLFIPGIAGRFQIYQFFLLLFVVKRFMDLALNKTTFKRITGVDQHCALFIIVWIVFLMLLRGTGMRVFGSRQYGGSIYIQALASLAFYIYSSQASDSKYHLRRAGILMGLCAVLPLLANSVFVFSGGRIWQQMIFLRAGGAAVSDAFNIQEGIRTRLSFLAAGSAFIWVGVFLSAFTSCGKAPKYFWWGVASVFTLLAGYRSTAISLLAFFLLYGFWQTRRKFFYVFTFATLGMLLYGGFFFFGKNMPFPVQRVLSGVPGIDVEWQAKAQAATTMAWRKDLWTMAASDIRQYWLIGRGATFSFSDTLPSFGRSDTVRVAYLTGAFHQATLELLILYGMPMLLACLMFYGSTINRAYRFLISGNFLRNHPESGACMLALLSYVSARTLLAFAGGQSVELLVELPVYLSFYNIIRNTVTRDEAES